MVIARTGLWLAVAGSFAVGCSDSDSPDPDPVLVTIQTGTPPALLAFRDAASTEWQAHATAGTRTTKIPATGPYEIVIVCATEGDRVSVGVAHYARTPADESLIEHRCRDRFAPFIVRGELVQPGMVSLGEAGQGTTASNWDFEFETYPGTFDLVVLTGDITTQLDRIAMKRDIEVIDDTQLGTIDLPLESTQPLVLTLFTASNLQPGESLSSSALLRTPSTRALLDQESSEGQSTWSTLLAPDSALLPTDRQQVRLYAHESTGTQNRQRYRGVARDVRVGDPTSVTLPDPLGTVQFATSTDRLAAQWSELPEYDELALERYSSGVSTTRNYRSAVSRHFIDASGATIIALDFRDIPGFKSEWNIDPGHGEYHVFSVIRGPATDRTHWGVSESIGAPTSRAARHSTALLHSWGEP